jgi:hypothetical protein
VDGYSGGAFSAPDPDEDAACGCKKGGAGLFLLPGLLLWRRRQVASR